MDVVIVLWVRGDGGVRDGRVREVARGAGWRPGAGHARRLQADHLRRQHAPAQGGLLAPPPHSHVPTHHSQQSLRLSRCNLHIAFLCTMFTVTCKSKNEMYLQCFLYFF